MLQRTLYILAEGGGYNLHNLIGKYWKSTVDCTHHQSYMILHIIFVVHKNLGPITHWNHTIYVHFAYSSWMWRFCVQWSPMELGLDICQVHSYVLVEVVVEVGHMEAFMN